MRRWVGRFALAGVLAALGFGASLPGGHLAADPSAITLTSITSLPRITIAPPVPDLAISISDSPDPVFVGQPLTYTVTAKNNGPGETRLVKVTDTLPSGVSLGPVNSSQGGCTPGSTISCELNVLQAGASATIKITVTPGHEGVITDTASVSGSETPIESNKRNNTATEQTTVKPVADLHVSKSGAPDPVLVGQALSYELKATNSGPSAASGVTVTDPLPAGVVFVSSSPACNQAGAGLTCAVGSLGKGASATVTLQVRPTKAGLLTNTASVSGNENDPVTADNTASAKTRVKPAADLAIVKRGAPDPVGVGNNLTYVLTVTNNGPSAAGAVTVKDALPAGLELESSKTSQGSGCTHAANTLTCHLGTLPSRGAATATLEVKPGQAGSVTNTASVKSGVSDPVTSNDRAKAQTHVEKHAKPVVGADLALQKAAAPKPVALRGKLTYTLVTTNSGPDQAHGIKLVDELPAGLELVSATSGKGKCSGNGTVTCELGGLPVGALAKVTIVVRPRKAGEVRNIASVTANEPDPDPGNNSAQASTKVIGRSHGPLLVLAPKLALHPALGPPGFVTQAIGRHFPGHADVLLTWNHGLGRVVLRAEGSGSFRVPVLIFYHDLLGRRQLVASSQGKPSFSPARAWFLVVPGTLQPPNFQPRG